MKLSTRATYGMRALVELALSPRPGPVSAHLIARRQALSAAYLEQILHRLKKHGLVRSIRGPRGGYLLAADPQRMTMAEVVRILDDHNGDVPRGARGRPQPARPKADVASVSTRPVNGAGRSSGRGRATAEPTEYAERIAQAVSRCVHERLHQALDAITLQDLCEEARVIAGAPLHHPYAFHI